MSNFRLTIMLAAMLLLAGCSGEKESSNIKLESPTEVSFQIIQNRTPCQIRGNPDAAGIVQYWYEFDMSWQKLAEKAKADPFFANWQSHLFSRGIVFTSVPPGNINIQIHDGGGTPATYNDKSKSSVIIQIRK